MSIRRILSDGTLEAAPSGGSAGATNANVLVVRSIGSTRPTTTGWAVNDAWLDTTSGGSTLRIWSGSAFVPAEAGAPTLGTLLLSDDFTGTDGAVWNASKWALGVDPSVGAGGAATLLSGAGVLQTSNAGSYNGSAVITRRASITDAADVNALFRFKFDSTQSYLSVYIRHNTNNVDGNNGYGFNASIPDSGWSISKNTAYSGPTLGSSQTLAFTAGTWYWCRFSCIGTAIKGKVWVDGVTEPGTFPVSVTDSTYTAAGKTGFRVAGGAAASSSRVFIDDITLRAS